MLDLRNIDNMELMREFPDKYFDLAIVDPPYGLGKKVVNSGGRFARYENKSGNWDMEIPPPEYFEELFRVSKKQIIFGGNYFPLPLVGGWLFWDKMRGKDVSFADGELAWTNFLTVIKKAPILYDGFLGADLLRIHPTQKPVKLYKWILNKFAEPGYKILDPNLGSGSSAIACELLGFDLVGSEIDEKYFSDMLQRIKEETNQIDLFK